ncbi:hypothetical protein GEV33_004698 [Tenebrio molitor]|jgi:hypothetical protein|uniref:Uncharacterized protein n=1 Tax=Tenebrio molitor TaxID=7067 RepID=A0A8J6LG50_TENMO|nr:hypothetical protein GEV33_004698 [Tenebrio molitor]
MIVWIFRREIPSLGWFLYSNSDLFPYGPIRHVLRDEGVDFPLARIKTILEPASRLK